MSISTGIYEHFKGGHYRVIGVARHSETGVDHVVYRPLYGEQEPWIRPLEMFLSTVEVDGREEPRFRFLEPAPGPDS